MWKPSVDIQQVFNLAQDELEIIFWTKYWAIHFEIEKSAARLENFFHGSTELMKILARACGHTSFKNFSPYDLVTWKKEMHHLSGVEFAGVN